MALAITPVDGEAVLRRVGWRLVPFMSLMYLLAYLDRVNLGFASLEMSGDLGFSDQVFAVGAGIFFVGYFVAEVPSNLMLHQVGARVWMSRIMVTWGLLAVEMMFVQGKWGLFGMRLLLGLAEAGFFPGMVLYLTYWFPLRYRARMTSLFYMASAVSGLVGGPVSGGLLSMSGVWGLKGWQWLFLMEGVPSVVVGVVAFWWLTDRPAKAGWLRQEERTWVEAEVERDGVAGERREHGRLLEALKDRRLWVLTACYFALNMGGAASTYWMPRVFKEVTGWSDGRVGWLTAAPWGVTIVTMLLLGRSSDRTADRRWHAAGSLMVAAAGLAWTPFCHSLVTAIVALTMATAGIASAVPVFWAIPGEFLRGRAAAGGIAAVNSVGNLGGFLGPFVVAFVRSRYQGFNGGLVVVAACVACGAVGVVLVRQAKAE